MLRTVCAASPLNLPVLRVVQFSTLPLLAGCLVAARLPPAQPLRPVLGVPLSYTDQPAAGNLCRRRFWGVSDSVGMADEKQYIEQSEWFETIVGKTEEQWRTYKNRGSILIDKNSDGHLSIVNCKTMKPYRAGKFSVLNMGKLLDIFREKQGKHPQAKDPVEFEIVTRRGRKAIKGVDVAYQQSLPENRHAVFQAASNFNGVECVSENSYPEDKNFVTNYIYDKTQGPAASISAGPGAITRVYAAFYKPGTTENPMRWQQTSKKQVEFLGSKSLKPHFPVKNGYVMLKDDKIPFPAVGSKEYEELFLHARVGYQTSVQVTFGESQRNGDKWYYRRVEDQEQIVDQVFTAAMNVGQGHSGMVNGQLKDSPSKMMFCLDAAYQGTYLSAIAHQRKHIFLTAIGGGVFGNPRRAIYEAITRAHHRFAYSSTVSGLKKVTLIIFDEARPEDVQHLTKFFNANGIPCSFSAYEADSKGNIKKTVLQRWK